MEACILLMMPVSVGACANMAWRASGHLTLVDVHLRWVWMDRGSMKIAQDRAALVRMNISALMNCCSVDYVAPQGSLLVSCSLDDADTSLSLQRQKAMDLISTIRQVC